MFLNDSLKIAVVLGPLEAQFSPITTFPRLPQNTLASNYSGLQLFTEIGENSLFYSVCSWRVSHDGVRVNEVFFYSISFANPCGNRTAFGSVRWDTSCTTNANGFISTSLRMYTPIFQAGLLNVTVQCFENSKTDEEPPDEEAYILIDIRGLLENTLTAELHCSCFFLI